jgi:SecD/SecF fusion protein
MKTRILIAILVVLFLYSCSQNEGKTEFKIQLSEAPYIWSMSNYSSDSVFLSAYHLSLKSFNPIKDDFLNVFTGKLLEINKDCILASYFSTFDLKDKISFKSTNQEVITVLNNEIKAAREKTIQVLKNRIDAAFKSSSFLSKLTGDEDIVIKESTEKNNYLFSIKRKVDKNRLAKLLEASGYFGFWETYELKEIYEYFVSANKKLNEILKIEPKEQKSFITNGNDSILNEKDLPFKRENPLFSLLRPAVNSNGVLNYGAVIGTSNIKDTAKINEYLSLKEIKSLMPRDLKPMWDMKPTQYNKEYIDLVAIKVSSRDGRPPLSGDLITEASASLNNGRAFINIKMNAEGARVWGRMTRDNIGKQIAIVFNNAVYSHPVVNSEIKGGNSEITGNFSPEEAQDFASVLNAGSMLKLSVKVIDIKEIP